MRKTITLIIFILISCCIASINASSDRSGALQISMLNQNPDPGRAGDTFELRLKVENRGSSPLQNLQIELVEDYPFAVVNDEALVYIGTLDESERETNSVILKYTVKVDKDAMKGNQELRIRYKFNTNTGWSYQTLNINLINKEFAQIIYVDKAKINPGKETDLKFTVINTGTAPLQNLVFTWSDTTGAILPVYSDNSKYIKYLDINESAELTYTVIGDVNADPGLYPIDLNLTYENLNGTSTVLKTRAGLFLGGETDFDVAFSQSTQGTTSLSVSNTGNNPAQSVSVKIPQQSGFKVTGSNAAIIGNLDKGDYTLVSFQITQNNPINFTGQARESSNKQDQKNTNAPESNGGYQVAASINKSSNSNNLIVNIEYTDTTGERRSVEKSVPIQMRTNTTMSTNGFSRTASSTSSSLLGSTALWICAIVIVMLVIILKKKERRNYLMEKITQMMKKTGKEK